VAEGQDQEQPAPAQTAPARPSANMRIVLGQDSQGLNLNRPLMRPEDFTLPPEGAPRIVIPDRPFAVTDDNSLNAETRYRFSQPELGSDPSSGLGVKGGRLQYQMGDPAEGASGSIDTNGRSVRLTGRLRF